MKNISNIDHFIQNISNIDNFIQNLSKSTKIDDLIENIDRFNKIDFNVIFKNSTAFIGNLGIL